MVIYIYEDKAKIKHPNCEEETIWLFTRLAAAELGITKNKFPMHVVKAGVDPIHPYSHPAR